jgi:Zn-dependent metalloprotease
VHDETLSVAAMCVSNEESSSLAIRQQGQLLEHPEDFEDDNDNDNYSDYVENVSVHAGTHIKSGVRWSAFIQIERAIAISKSLNSILIADA